MQQDDAKLVALSQNGDLPAFNQIVERYQSQVYSVAARIVGDFTTAEDISQETFISAHRALSKFRGGSLRAWLLRIASNLSYDFLRSTKRRPETSLDESLENPSFSLPSKDPSPERVAELGELRSEIERAIASLPDDQRATLVLIDVQGFSYEETSEATGANMGTVKSRLSRARRGVRDYLKDHTELLPDRFRQSD